MNVETNVVTLEVVEAAASLRQAIHAACMHENGMEMMKKAGDGVNGVLHRTVVEVVAHAKKVDPSITAVVLKGLFFEALLDAEGSIKLESSPFKHMQKLPRCWINAKSIVGSYLEYDQIDFDKHKTVSAMGKFNKDTKKAADAADVANAIAKASESGLSLVKDAEADAGPAGGNVNIEKSEATQTDVKVTQVDTTDLDPVLADLLAKIATAAGNMDAAKAVKMLTGFETQLSQVAAKAMGNMAKVG
jgi:hypothetical protein